MTSSFPHFASTSDWLDSATLPDGEAEHPKLSKSVALELARKNSITAPDLIHSFWVELTRAGNRYERLRGLDFNCLPIATRTEIGALLKSLTSLKDQIDRLSPSTVSELEAFAFRLDFEAQDSGDDDLTFFEKVRGNRTPLDSKSVAAFSVEIDGMISFLKGSRHRLDKPLKGRPPNFALLSFVRCLLTYWTGTLCRAVTVDHNARAAYSDAPAFIAGCVKLLDDIDDATVNSAVRAWNTDKK